jgi:CDP-paratose 2-epimerase
VAHFGRALFGGEPITLFGDGFQVRDILWVDDLVEAMRLATDRIDLTAGQVFNVGGGPGNAVTVRDVVERLEEVTGRSVPVLSAGWRPGDQRIYVSDTARIERVLGWRPRTPWSHGLERLVAWLEEAKLDRPALAVA